MADCSYSKCLQQKRHIRRELQRWTKNMVHIVGLERIAEELMGRRKWKLYQESMSRNYLQPLNNNAVKQEKQFNNHTAEKVQKEVKEALPPSPKNEVTAEPAAGDPLLPLRENGEKEEVPPSTESDTKPAVNGTVPPSVDGGQDWKPQDKCYFCVDGNLDSENHSHGVLSPRHSESESSDSPSDSEAPASLTPSQAARLRGIPTPNMTTMEMSALAAVAALAGGAAGPGGAPTPHLPFYPMHNWYLTHVARSFQAERLQAAAAEQAERGSGEQPLDLSKGSSAPEKVPNNIRLPTLDTKHIFKAKPRMSTVAGRRTYTEDELQAALRDIQSGKLGTRRAAVIYGIPRSTLRNKVYKLALEKERETHLNNAAPLKLEEEEVIMDEDKELSGAEEEKEVEKALEAPLLSMADILRFSKVDNSPEALKAMLLKSKEAHEGWPMEGEVAPYTQSLILASQKAGDASVMNHIEFVKRMIAEETLLKAKLNGDSDKHHRSNADKPRSIAESSDMETEESSSSVILKIPSFRPTTSKNGSDSLYRAGDSSMVSPPVTSDSSSPPIMAPKMSIKDVKDVIAQSISQKFQQSLEQPIRPIMEMDFKRNDFTPPLGSGGISVIKSNPQDVSRFSQANKQMQQHNSGGNNSAGGKGTRPKRGKYRNYDRDSLVEAVRAVQRGEMSVHRAGSYYGVPHSTLEYKVKERHLMRPRKRDPKPNPVDEKIASLKQNDIRIAQEKIKPSVVIKPQQKFSPTSPNGIKLPMFEPGMAAGLPGYNAPHPFPFWPHPGYPHIPLDYPRNSSATFPPNPEFFASQMIQKLQEESSRSLKNQNSTTPTLASASARQMAESLLDAAGSNGSFLDGIIRSSLESGVPINDDKSPKDEKCLAPEKMSNKALLDQLCRNSRLTPLSKGPNHDNSSGDESYNRGNSPPINFATGSNSKSDDSPQRRNSELHTIELNSNDSNDSSPRRTPPSNAEDTDSPMTNNKPHGRIYLKQDLVNPDNLKPEMLVRGYIPELNRNGGSGLCDNDSASENEATAQD